jgi:hypothetical protein
MFLDRVTVTFPRIVVLLKRRQLFSNGLFSSNTLNTSNLIILKRILRLGWRSKWLRGLSCRSSAARLLRFCVRIPSGAWMFVSCESCVLSGRGLCDGLIIRPEESYRLWRVVVCDKETSNTLRLKPVTGL